MARSLAASLPGGEVTGSPLGSNEDLTKSCAVLSSPIAIVTQSFLSNGFKDSHHKAPFVIIDIF